MDPSPTLPRHPRPSPFLEILKDQRNYHLHLHFDLDIGPMIYSLLRDWQLDQWKMNAAELRARWDRYHPFKSYRVRLRQFRPRTTRPLKVLASNHHFLNQKRIVTCTPTTLIHPSFRLTDPIPQILTLILRLPTRTLLRNNRYHLVLHLNFMRRRPPTLRLTRSQGSLTRATLPPLARSR